MNLSLKKTDLRLWLPFILLMIHHHISNSPLGFHNPYLGISFFLTFLFSMSFFLINDFKFTYLNAVVVNLLIVFIGLWLVKPSIFKDIASIYINMFCVYYIISNNSFEIIKKQLKILVIISAVLSVIQIAGITELVHLLNSQFIAEKATGFIRDIELHNILNYNNLYNDSFDSRHVRANGIFHSSAILSGIYVIYIAFVFLGYYTSKKSVAIIPFLVIFSGSKLVLLSAVILLLVTLFLKNITFKRILILFISSLICTLLHRWLFYALMDFQFSVDILLFSINIRLKDFNFKVKDLEYFLPFLLKAIALFILLYIILKTLKITHFKKKIFHFSIVIIAFISSFIATPHVGNVLFGWFFLPCFFWLKHTKRNS
jgi:hypothetical protein